MDYFITPLQPPPPLRFFYAMNNLQKNLEAVLSLKSFSKCLKQYTPLLLTQCKRARHDKRTQCTYIVQCSCSVQ